MSSRHGHTGSTTSLKAIVLSGLLLLSGSASASFVDHTSHEVIAEPRLINIPTAYRGHHPHGSLGHRHRVRYHQKRSEGVVVEAPYTIWTGTFEDLKRRAPVAATGDTTETKDSTSTDAASEDDACTGIVCPKGYYCTKDGCCPNGKKCTGVKTCLDATESECPDNIACCPKASPVCRVNNGQGVCMKGKQEDPTTTSEPPKPAPTKVTKVDPTTTSEPPKPTSTKATKADVTTSTTSSTSEPETSTEETSTSTTETTTSSSEQNSATPPPAAVPTDPGVATPEPSPTPVDTPSTTLAAPTPSSTAKNREPSGSTKIISSAVAGSIVALAFGTLIIYTIVKKRKENALARAEEASKSAPMSAPTSAAPMGSGGNGRPLSIQPEPEMLHMSPQAPAAVFTSGPQRGISLRDGIPPPSPPPNAMVVGTPPYRREQLRGQPGTPTSLRAGVPGPQIAQPWHPAEGFDNNYQQNFPFPEEAHDAGYNASGSYSPGGSYPPGAHTPSTGSYQAYSPPSTPMYPPGTARSPH